MIASNFLKKLLLSSLCGLLVPLSASATVTINLNAGFLGQNATTPMNSGPGGGALLLLIASGSANGTTFTTPNAGSFVGGNDVVLAASGFNTGGGTNAAGLGETRNTFPAFNLPSTASSTPYIELRWYPNISLTDYTSGVTPAGGSSFGAYNPSATNLSGNTSLAPDRGNAWQISGNGTFTLNFYTQDDRGTQVVSEGYAMYMVPVPEPTTGTLSGLALIVIVGAKGIWRRAKTA